MTAREKRAPRPKAVECWAVLQPTGAYLHVRNGNTAPILYSKLRDARSMAWAHEEPVRVRVVPVPPRRARGQRGKGRAR